MNENFFSKNEPAVIEHRYHITKKQYNEDIHNIYNLGKSKSYKTNNHNFIDTHSYNKQTIYHKPFNELHNQKE